MSLGPQYLVITPLGPVNQGVGINGTNLDQLMKITMYGSGVVSGISAGIAGAGYSLVGSPASILSNGNSTTFTVRGTGTSTTINGTLTINASCLDDPILVSFTATFIATGSLVSSPSAVVFPVAKINTASSQTIQLQNSSGGNITVTGLNFNDANFTLDASVPALPFTIAGGGNQNVKINFSHNELGVIAANLAVLNSAGNFNVAISASTVFLFPVDILTGNTFALLLALDTGGGPLGKQASSGQSALNIDQISTLVFNGALWESPGMEKTIERLEILYQNEGTCTGLVATLAVYRPSLGTFDIVNSLALTIGDGTADHTERSAFFDLTASGEIAILSLTRPASAGPISILGFIPHFVDRGEKVENV